MADPVTDTRAELEAEARGVELPPWFFDDTIVPSLTDRAEREVRRLIAAPASRAWEVIADPAALPAWTPATGARALGGGPTLQPGARIVARGRIGHRRLTSDRSLVTRVEEGRLLAWATRSRVLPLPGVIEFRWTLEVEPHPDGCELIHRLLGVALPDGAHARPLRRAWARATEDLPLSMTRGLERLAAAIEARAR